MRRRAFATALAFVLATLAVGSRSAPASAASCPGHTAELGIRLVDVTRRLVTDPRARTYVIDHLAPGTTISRRVEVVNGTAAAVRLRLYPAAATIAGDRFVFLEGRTPDELTGWTAITPREVTLPACGRARPKVTITVPERVTDGERYAVVWAERQPPVSAKPGVQLAVRVGIRLYLSVGKGREPAFDFTIKSLRAGRDHSGRPFVIATVVDVGGRAVDLTGQLRLSHGPHGTLAGPYPADQGVTLAPGSTGPVTFRLAPGLPAGRWTADVVLRSGKVRRRARVRIEIPEQRATLAGPVQIPRGGATPLISGLLGGLVMLLGMALLARIRHRPRARGSG